VSNRGSGASPQKLNNHEHGDTGIGILDGSGKTFYLTEPATEAAKEWEGYGTALKPAHEPICVARKPLEGTVAANVLKNGTGALNIDGCRVDGPARADGGMSGAHDEQDVLGNGGLKKRVERPDDSLGRWPANIIHDGSDEVVSLFPLTGDGNGKGAYSYAGIEYDNKDTSMFNGDKPQGPSNYNESGSAARFFYTAKASQDERGTGNNHPTVKPLDLMAYLCKLLAPPSGGILLDPFMGSGSTIIAGRRFYQHCIGIELEEKYAEIAAKRLSQEVFDFGGVA
jgi:site-specific DNA-methyltransferase (adenine-specific)